jgi:cell cycle sensor histidine kinase DivJ
VPTGLPPIRADERVLKPIVLNLILNTVKFSENKVRVRLSAAHEQGKTILQVEDDGNGIAAEKLPKITEPFAQSHSNPHAADDGLGLGLSIVKSLVAMHEGELDIWSAEGKGTTIRATLPT